MATSLGNPLVFFILLGNFPSAFISLKGNIIRLSAMGVLLLIKFGLIYILALSGIRKALGNEPFSRCIEIIALRLGIISVLGLTLPMLFWEGIEWNIFGFIVAIPYYIFAFVYVLFSYHAVFR